MDNKQDFTQGSILKKMVGFMFPILGALVLQAMYGAVDLLIVGRFGTPAGISGVSTGSNIINMFTFILVGLASGVTILIGRYLGEQRTEKIGPLIGNAIAFFLVFAAGITVTSVLCAEPLARLLQAPEEALHVTMQYIRICGGGFLFVMLYNLISCVFRGMGNSRLPLIFVAIACVVNIVLDLLFVAWLQMDVAGAALATVLAQAVSVVLSLAIIRKEPLPFVFHLKDIRFGSGISRFVRIGAPLALQDLLTNFTFLALCAFINDMGLDASNGYGIAQKIQSFVMLIPAAIMQCMSAFVAQNVGAGREDRAKKGMLYGMAIGSSIGVFIALLAFFKGDLLAEIFSENPQDIARAFEFLRGFAIEAVVTSILFSFMGYFNGHAMSVFVMAQGLIQSFLVRLPVSYFMSRIPDASLTGIGLAAPAATIFGIGLCFWYYCRQKKKGLL